MVLELEVAVLEDELVAVELDVLVCVLVDEDVLVVVVVDVDVDEVVPVEVDVLVVVVEVQTPHMTGQAVRTNFASAASSEVHAGFFSSVPHTLVSTTLWHLTGTCVVVVVVVVRVVVVVIVVVVAVVVVVVVKTFCTALAI